MAEWMPFNVNYYVRVKLTPFGISVLHNAHEALRKRWKGLNAWNPPETDAEGYTRFQAWELMQTFGPHMRIGANNVPFETEILIERHSTGKSEKPHG